LRERERHCKRISTMHGTNTRCLCHVCAGVPCLCRVCANVFQVGTGMFVFVPCLSRLSLFAKSSCSNVGIHMDGSWSVPLLGLTLPLTEKFCLFN
jgi:hypothetical protein